MRVLVVALVLLSAVSAKKGWDGIQAVSKAGFECLHKNGFDFFAGRVGTEVGTVDHTGVQNVKDAREAGWKDVSGYIYPCIASHCPSAATQVANVHNALKAKGAALTMLWLDIEGTWGSDHAHNRKFIEQMANEGKKLGYKVGIYSGQYSWPPITGSWTGMSHLPLWWPNYDNVPGFGPFHEYGGWKKPHIHQYKGTTKGPCGVSMDLNYME